jgi:hypothetical protein
MGLETEAQIGWAEGEAVYPWLGELARLGDRLNGLDLELEDAIVVSPLGIREAIIPAFDTAPGGSSPAPVVKLGVVKIRQGLSHRGLVLDLRDLDSRSAKVEQVADEVGMGCMLDAELDGYLQFLRYGTELHQPLLIEGRVLAIHGDKIIGVFAHNVLQPLAVGGYRGRDAYDDLPLVDALLR